MPVRRLTLTPDRHFGHLLLEPVAVTVTAGSCRSRVLAASQALPDGQDAVDNDGVDTLFDLSLW